MKPDKIIIINIKILMMRDTFTLVLKTLVDGGVERERGYYLKYINPRKKMIRDWMQI